MNRCFMINFWGDGMRSRYILKSHLRQNAGPTTWVWENLKGYYAITQEHRYADNLNLFLSRGPSPFEKGIESCCLVHMGVRDERRVFAIDLSQPRHEIALWLRHNGPVTSLSTELMKWPIHPWYSIDIYGHIDTCDTFFMTPICRTSTPVQVWQL